MRILLFDNTKLVFRDDTLHNAIEYSLLNPYKNTTTEVAKMFGLNKHKFGCSVRRVNQKIQLYFKSIPKWNKGLTKEEHEALQRIALKTSKIKKGVKLSQQHRLAISIAHKKASIRDYSNDTEALNKSIRKSVNYKFWRESVYKRDNFTCKKCKTRGGKLHPHHIKNFSQYPDLRFELTNGVTLCEKCHKTFHKLFGQSNNNLEQLNSYLYD